MSILARRGGAPDTLTVLAGYPGWLNEDSLPAEDSAALGPSLLQLGPVGEADLWALYRNATLFAFPSRHEGFGLPVVEAMSQGVAVIASDIEVMREVAGPAAVLVPPDEPVSWAGAIEGLLGDAAARLRLGRSGTERSRLFTASAMAAATRAVYQTIGS
jgi:alpha-1,3-rhamnosyl/mannosyltransferase